MTIYVLPDELRCKYPFKFCNNERTFKVSGERYMLCKEHRDRANRYTAGLTTGRSRYLPVLSRPRQQAADLSMASLGAPHLDKVLLFADIADLLDDRAVLVVDCSEEDLRAVEPLLSD